MMLHGNICDCTHFIGVKNLDLSSLPINCTVKYLKYLHNFLLKGEISKAGWYLKSYMHMIIQFSSKKMLEHVNVFIVKTIRYLFQANEFVVLDSLLEDLEKIHYDDSLYLAIAAIYVYKQNKIKAKQYYKKIIQNTSFLRIKSKASLMLNLMGDHSEIKSITEGNVWHLLYTFIAKKHIKVESINKMNFLTSAPKDKLWQQLATEVTNKNYDKCLNLIYSFNQKDLKSLSITAFNTIQLILKVPGLSICLGKRIFGNSGVIISDFFNLLPELNQLIDSQKITKHQAFVTFAIGIMETNLYFWNAKKYMAHDGISIGWLQITLENLSTYYNTNNTLITHTKKTLDENLKKQILHDVSLNTMILKNCLEDFSNRYSKNHLLFLLFFYNTGSHSVKLQNIFKKFVNFHEPLNIIAFLDIITEKQSSYVIRVLENYIIIMLSHLPFKNNAYININLLLHNPYFPIEN